ncbi:chemotaxis protein CheA [Modicisalibacter tunisiensis]|uniref:Chemotaxis protein CheA n=1 Tax=Modicisalibacter tunisiensis TaxID=390637 RepID=A0ABS7X2W9_9GAMM|nr:chemotaxis protein CheA [Modicisalibacter tunisiensis]MBZ9538277.1 chemotaxis protein CheA [Modicisalibacter tunisiensis]MBZ9568312.1 chemotaxis protein CheA [Modicisalibacter tunisiensis]
MDISDFYETFFEEAEELLGDMERHLLDLDVDDPDPEQLNAIFRAAHSIKGGAGTFGFLVLQETTHILENLLDHTRRGELSLRRDIVDTFLEAKDMLHDQLDAYRNGAEPDPEAFERICRTLKQLALDELGKSMGSDPPSAASAGAADKASPEPPAPAPRDDDTADAQGGDQAPSGAGSDKGGEGGDPRLQVALLKVGEKDRQLLVEELGQLGEVVAQSGDEQRYVVEMTTTVGRDDIEAVMCFIIEPEQLEITPLGESAPSAGNEPGAGAPARAEPQEAPAAAPVEPARAPSAAPAAREDKGGKTRAAPKGNKAKGGSESSSIRVPVDKVDQIINLVGELIITQAMLDQTASEIDGVTHSALHNGLNLLKRNARDLQESVMSIRMMPMDYVFSRFPRLVRDLAAKLDKEIELVTEGKSTELDKSLIERIIDPLTHLVRNSLDHGIESPEAREAAGKPRTGQLTLSAQHQGGNILIEVIDDGAGLSRERILAKAHSNGLNVSDTMSDDEVWQLIFAPGFSTAEQVSDVSGRGVGMDVVKRNIQSMGGHVEIMSRPGEGTTTRIVLPLTLAILDGMSIKVGEEVFILPLGAVLESLQPSREDLYSMAGDDLLLKVRDEYLPVIALHQVLDVAEARTEITECIVVIVQGEGRRYALVVDDLIGQQQVVVKNLETNYRKVPGISAATILGDGSVALILDIVDLHRLSRRKSNPRAAVTTSSIQEVHPS